MPTVESFCEIKKNVKVDKYIAVSGSQSLILTIDGTQIASCDNEVLWKGSGSPYPTPPGGPWKTKFIGDHAKFKECWKVNSTRESDIFIHFGSESYGCYMIPRTEEGREFFAAMMQYRDDITVVQHEIVDDRNSRDKEVNPIDYTAMTRYIE